VIFIEASSKGRGSRAAGWFADYIVDKADKDMESIVLTGGINEWVAGGVEFIELVTEYQAEAWTK
jgi:arsenical-resistance protein 2